MLYDIHGHLNDKKFDSDLDQVAAELLKRNCKTNVIGYDIASSQKAIDIAAKYPNVYAIVGIHPDEAEDSEFDSRWFDRMCDGQPIVGVGECGFDFYRKERTTDLLDKQKTLFRQQIEWALDENLPIMVHVRATAGTDNAYEDTYQVLEEYARNHDNFRANIHFFPANKAWAESFLDIGCTLSFTGVVTYDSSYDELLKWVPLDHIMVETDAPYVAPEPYRGQRAMPWHVHEIIQKIATVKELQTDDVAEVMYQNAQQYFLE